MSDVVAHRGLRAARVAIQDRLHDARMVGARLFDLIREQEDLVELQSEDREARLVQHVGQFGIPAQPQNQIVKFVVVGIVGCGDQRARARRSLVLTWRTRR